MRMEHLCLIMLCICVSIVLGYALPVGEKILFVHSPPSLLLKPGENVTFICNISALNYTPEDMSWYKTQNSAEKIADLKNTKNERIRIITNWVQREAKLLIINVTFNDSGKYFCSHVNMTTGGQIIVSNMSELLVKSFLSTVTYSTNPIDLPGGKSDSLKMSIISSSVILTLLLLLAVGSAIILIWYKQRKNISQPQQQDLEKPPQDPSIYTVNYGILQFGAGQPDRKSAELRVSEQVEYATIMFPPQTPSMEEKRGRST